MNYEDLRNLIWEVTEYYIDIVNEPLDIEDMSDRRVERDRRIGYFNGFYENIMRYMEHAYPARIKELSEWLLNKCYGKTSFGDMSIVLEVLIADPLFLSMDQLRLRREQIRKELK